LTPPGAHSPGGNHESPQKLLREKGAGQVQRTSLATGPGGDFAPTWEIITQPSVDKVLAGTGVNYLEKFMEKTSYIPPSLVPEASPLALTAEAEGNWRDAGTQGHQVPFFDQGRGGGQGQSRQVASRSPVMG